MAWNEPGGGKQKDPWGGGEQGPPDLDEAFKKLQEKLNGLFGGGGGGAGRSGGGLSGGLITVVFAVVVVIYFALGFYQVDQQERAVVLRLGNYHSTVNPGLHWNWPLVDSVMKENVTKVRSIDHRSQMLTEDENIVDVAISVQYTVAKPEDFLLRIKQPEASLAQATESALRHVVGGSVMDQVITEGREQIAVDVQERLQQYLDVYHTGILVAKVNIEEAHAPSQVQEAFDDVTRAKEDRERLKNEAEAYANSIIPEARGRAQRQIEESNAYKEQVIARAEGEAARFDKLVVEYRRAPEVTRSRLYLETVQNVLSSSSKVLVDVPGGNNVLYLPLDKMAAPRGAETSRGSGESDAQADILMQQLRRDGQQPVRLREGR